MNESLFAQWETVDLALLIVTISSFSEETVKRTAGERTLGKILEQTECLENETSVAIISYNL